MATRLTCPLTDPTVATRIAVYGDTSGNIDGSCTATCVGGTITGAVTGTCSSCSALAADGGNCPANQAAGGVDTLGAAQACVTPLLSPGGVSGGRIVLFLGTGGQSTQQSSCSIGSPATSINGCGLGNATAGNANTATALAANGANCVNPGEFATGVDASGKAEGCAVPTTTAALIVQKDDVTIDGAATTLDFDDTDAAGLVTSTPAGEANVLLDKYALLSGRSGGQRLIGGVGTNKTLVLQSDTLKDGNIILGDDPTQAETVIVHGTSSTHTENFVNLTPIFTVIGAGALDQPMVSLHGHAALGEPMVDFVRSRGTESSPTVVSSGDILGDIQWTGRGGSTYQPGARIRGTVTEGTPSDAAMGTKLDISTTPNGSVAPVVHNTFDQNGQLVNNLATGTAPFVVASTTKVANLQAATAAALTANGANCVANAAAGGVDASGAAESCVVPLLTPGAVTADRLVKFSGTGGQATVQSGCVETGNIIGNCDLAGNASTSTSFASNKANCAAGSFPLGVDASGGVESCTVPVGGAGLTYTQATTTFDTASDEQNFIKSGALTCGASTQGKALVHTTPLQYCDNSGTPTLRYAAYGSSTGVATSATALAGNGANCAAGSAAGGVDASGAAENCIDHGGLGGLADDDHTQYALLAGRSGGQILTGGTAPGDHLTLQSTSDTTRRGFIMADDGIDGAPTYVTGTGTITCTVAGNCTCFDACVFSTELKVGYTVVVSGQRRTIVTTPATDTTFSVNIGFNPEITSNVSFTFSPPIMTWHNGAGTTVGVLHPQGLWIDANGFSSAFTGALVFKGVNASNGAGNPGANAGSVFVVTGGTGGNTSTAGGTGGSGGGFNCVGGIGGRAPGTGISGAGGSLSFASGNGGNLNSGGPGGVSGAGGSVQFVTGTGGAVSGTTSGSGGAGGALSFTTGIGTSGNTTDGSGGNGGDITLTAGAGGTKQGTGVAGRRGFVTMQPSAGFVGIGTTTPTDTFSVAEKLIVNSSGVVTKYNNVAKDTNHTGTPFTIASATATAQAADVVATTLVTSAAAGRYRLSCYVAVTQQATTTAVVPECNLICTDPTDSVVKTIKVTAAITGVAANPTTAVAHSGTGICDAKAATNVQYSTSNYASVGGTAMQFKTYAVLEAL